MTPRMTESEWQAHERRMKSAPKGVTRTPKGTFATAPIVCTSDVQEMWIPGILPGMNEIVAKAKQQRGRYSPYNDLKRTWEKHGILYIERAGIRPVQRCRLSFWYVEQNGKRDIDNVFSSGKFLIDALKKSGIIVDDSQRYVTDIAYSWSIDPVAPGVRLTITPVIESPTEG